MQTKRQTPGARLNLPRDQRVAYAIGRMGAATIADVWPMFWGAEPTARRGFGRLVRLDILRSFPRTVPWEPKWFALTRSGLEWVVGETGCDERDLRTFTSLGRVNLAALSMRNRLWASLAIAGWSHPSIKLGLFRPEGDLRAEREMLHAPVVPDALFVLTAKADPVVDPEGADEDTPNRRDRSDSRHAFATELDGGTERAAIWRVKAEGYVALRNQGTVYGEPNWSVLALVPSVRRARSVATAVVQGGAGRFTYLVVAEDLASGRALTARIFRAAELAAGDLKPGFTLVEVSQTPINNPDQLVDRGVVQGKSIK